MTGPDVLSWQKFLNEQGFSVGDFDGKFGPRTKAATQNYQRSEALDDDGVAGPVTLGRAGLAGMQTLRRIADSEVTAAMRAEAVRILGEHKSSPFGTEIPFESGGRQWVARIEEHYRDPKSKKTPRGYHVGVTLFAPVGVVTQDVEEDEDEVDHDTWPAPSPASYDPAAEPRFRLGDSSKKKLALGRPEIIRLVERAILVTEIDFLVHEVMRTTAQQAKYVANGASTTMNSRHLTGHAVDLIPLVDGKPSYHWAHYYTLARAVQRAARDESIVVTWGAVWDRDLNAMTEDLEDEVADYVARCKAKKKKAFLDGAHVQLAWSRYP